MEKIELKMKENVIHTRNFWNETSVDYTVDNTFIFEKGKIYGIVGEHGMGGEVISQFLTNQISLEEEKIYFDDVEANDADIQQTGWYVGRQIYSRGLIKREISVRKALNYAVKKYHRYGNIDDIVEEFHLTPGRLDYELSKYSGERFRASLAVGYASNRIIYCFPWMNTACFNDLLLSSGVFRFFKKMRKEGLIIILPTSRKKNVIGFVDEVIEINNPRFDRVISDSPYFKQYY